MTQLRKAIAGLFIILFYMACESDSPEPVSTTVHQEQKNDPTDDEFQEQIQVWLDDQQELDLEKRGQAYEDSLK